MTVWRRVAIFVPMTGNARREFRLPKQGCSVPSSPPNLDGWLDRPLSVITGGHPAPLGSATDLFGGRLSAGATGESPSPQLPEGEGEEPPSQSSPQMGEEGDHPRPSAPLDSGPVSSTGQAFRWNDGVMQGSPPYRVRGRLRATRCRAAPGDSPSPRPSPVEGEGVRAPFHARYSVV